MAFRTSEKEKWRYKGNATKRIDRKGKKKIKKWKGNGVEFNEREREELRKWKESEGRLK